MPSATTLRRGFPAANLRTCCTMKSIPCRASGVGLQNTRLAAGFGAAVAPSQVGSHVPIQGDPRCRSLVNRPALARFGGRRGAGVCSTRLAGERAIAAVPVAGLIVPVVIRDLRVRTPRRVQDQRVAGLSATYVIQSPFAAQFTGHASNKAAASEDSQRRNARWPAGGSARVGQPIPPSCDTPLRCPGKTRLCA
jgi:hypothetical protein